jgi:hypothetical protein
VSTAIQTGPSRKRRKIFWVAGAASALIGLMTAALVGFGSFCLRTRHFEELQIGMTRAEVATTIEIGAISKCYYTGDGPSREDWEASYSENRSLPPFVANLTFVDGRLETKELRKPSILDILHHLWTDVTPPALYRHR